MSNSNSINERISSVINAATSIVEPMDKNTRIQIKELAARVTRTTTNVDAKDVLTLVSFFARNTDLGYVARGKNGGLIRGTRPAKPTPTQTKEPSINDEDCDDGDDLDSDDE